MRLRNVSPLGALDLPLIGRILEPAEEFEVPDEVGERLLEQPANYEQVVVKPTTQTTKEG